MTLPTRLSTAAESEAADNDDVSPERRWVFITWYPYCRRSDALGEQLGARSYLVHYLRFKAPLLAPIKYVLQTFKTAWILLREMPEGVLVANPPVVAPLVIWIGSVLLRYRYIVDAHSGAFQHARWNWTLPLQRFLSRCAVTTIVTNETMASMVQEWEGKFILVQDLALELNLDGPARRRDRFHVVFICTYSVDEPVREVLEAARMLGDVDFSFTGDPSYSPRGFRESLPANVELTGFLPDSEYLALLRGADIILVLTREDNTMQRGGYEAMALEKPLITSDWPLLRRVFASGTVHVDNSAEGIVRAIRSVRENAGEFRSGMAAQRRIRAEISGNQVTQLRRICRSIGASGGE